MLTNDLLGVSSKDTCFGVTAKVRIGKDIVNVPIVKGEGPQFCLGNMTLDTYVQTCRETRTATSVPSPALLQGMGAVIAEGKLRAHGWQGRGTQAMRIMRLTGMESLIESATAIVNIHELLNSECNTFKMPWTEAIPRVIAYAPQRAGELVKSWIRTFGTDVSGIGGSYGATLLADAICEQRSIHNAGRNDGHNVADNIISTVADTNVNNWIMINLDSNDITYHTCMPKRKAMRQAIEALQMQLESLTRAIDDFPF